MKTNLANIKKAKKLLYKRECIAIPTETVYGLAGNAYSCLLYTSPSPRDSDQSRMPASA